jgi:hypothetical protein
MAAMFFLPVPENVNVEIRRFFCGFTGVTALGIIFLYKKRRPQIAASLSLGLLLILFFAINFPVILKFEFSVSYLFLFIPLIAAVLAFAAYHAIKKDEELVRSLDRLR